MKPFALFTMQRNEQDHLPRWIDYYCHHFDMEDMYVLDHQSTNIRTVETLLNFAVDGGKVITRECDEVFNHDWLLKTVMDFQKELLKEYEIVIFTDCDEMLVPASVDLRHYLMAFDKPMVRATGFNVIEDKLERDYMFDKTLIARQPLSWVYGYHQSIPEVPTSDELLLIHLHRLNYQEAWQRNKRLQEEKWNNDALRGNLSFQNQIADEGKFREWFYAYDQANIVSIPDHIAIQLRGIL